MLSETEIILSKHAMLRIKERIGTMSNKEKYELARKAFVDGKTPVHFIEKDMALYKYLSYKQKTLVATVRVLEKMVYIYTNTKPYTLITCYQLPETFLEKC